jgi:hypothetical protein
MEEIINEVSLGKWKEAAKSSLPKRKENAEIADKATEKGWDEYDKNARRYPEEEPALYRLAQANDEASIKAKESCIPAGTYNCTFTLGSSTINLENIKFTSGLVDEHAPIYVRNRRIGEITTPIIAGDKRSQQIVFYI